MKIRAIYIRKFWWESAMADVKKWSVTYTKHVKQKRKVYQDGFLELDKTTNKVIQE